MTAKKNVEKFFLRSRGLWGGAIPLIVALLGFYGIATDPEVVANQLGELGTNLGLAIGSVMALWSRFEPDNAQLTTTPTATPAP